MDVRALLKRTKKADSTRSLKSAYTRKNRFV
jgi:hypothetical protein